MNFMAENTGTMTFASNSHFPGVSCWKNLGCVFGAVQEYGMQLPGIYIWCRSPFRILWWFCLLHCHRSLMPFHPMRGCDMMTYITRTTPRGQSETWPSFPCVTECFGLGQEFGKALQEIIPGSVFEEDLLTVDTPDHDVVKDSQCVQSGLSWHGKTLTHHDFHCQLRFLPASHVPLSPEFNQPETWPPSSGWPFLLWMAWPLPKR